MEDPIYPEIKPTPEEEFLELMEKYHFARVNLYTNKCRIMEAFCRLLDGFSGRSARLVKKGVKSLRTELTRVLEELNV